MTPTENFQAITAFIIELDKLKAVHRKTKPVGLDRYENSAEHSWQICLLAMTLASQAKKPVNIGRVVEILLVHDIPEIDAGDRIVYQGKDAATEEAEAKAARRLFGMLPPESGDRLLARWEEYEARQTDEAVYAYAIDRLMPLVQNLHNNGQSWRENKVPLSRILAVNAAIGEALPEVWEEMRQRIIRFAESNGIS